MGATKVSEISASDKESAWMQSLRQDPKWQLLNAQKEQKDLETAQKKQTNELNMALKFQKQFAANAQGKNGTLLTNPSANGVSTTTAPPPGQKELLGQ
jgi:hypothetical protein